MSLNNITSYGDNSNSHISGRVNNLFVRNSLNAVMDGANIGDEITKNILNEISWAPAGDVTNESLEHMQTRFRVLLVLDQTNFTQIPINVASIPDPLNKITVINNTIQIRNDLKSIFMLLVKYYVAVPDQNSSYEFKVEKKFSLNDVDGNWTDIDYFGRGSTAVVGNENIGEQSITCQIPIDSYSPGLLNTYYRFMYRKVGTSSNGGFVLYKTNISLIRLV